MKKNLLVILISVAVAAAQSGVVASSNAQTVYNGIGSSALTLQLGQAASTATPSGLGLGCIWSSGATSTSGPSIATDPTFGGTEFGTTWVAWAPGSDGFCDSVSTSSPVYAYLQTDSVVGNRCVFQQTSGVSSPCTVTITNNSACGKKIWGACEALGVAPVAQTETTGLPTGITSLFSSLPINFAGTDIRPEDAYFATVRAGAACSQIVNGSGVDTQYYGLGYPYATTGSPSQIKGFYTDTSNSTVFNIGNYPLPASYTVFRVGAVPVVIGVNQSDSTANGFNVPNSSSQLISNIDSDVFASFLDGSLSKTEDINQNSTGSEGVTVLLREFLSGTYNTMEFNVPNTLENQTSQDYGLNQEAAQHNCNGALGNPMHATTTAGFRNRTIGTGDTLQTLFGASNITEPTTGAFLGYGFWSTANFKVAYTGAAGWNTNGRYLTVDGVDPLLTDYGPYASASTPAATETPTSYSSTGTAVTINVASNTFTVGELVSLAGFTGSDPTTLNGLELPVTAETGTSFTVNTSAISAIGTTAVTSGGAWAGGLCPLGTCPAGTIPTQGNGGIKSVTLANVADGSYPIWSFVRLICVTGNTGCTGASSLAAVGPNFVSFGTGSSVPDFVFPTNVSIVRSHFLPPGIGTLSCTVANGTGPTTGSHAAPECGGDVGGVVLSIEGDVDYELAFQGGLNVKQSGETGRRR